MIKMKKEMKNKIRKKILALLGRRGYGLTIEEVANALHINRGTASKYLAILEVEKKVMIREVGKAKLHYLQKDFCRLRK